MSITGYRKKSLPLCLSLGIAPILNGSASLTDNFLAPLGIEDQKTLLFNTKHFAAVCYNPHPKERKVNPILISFAVHRILALKQSTAFPVLIVVKNKYEGELLAEELRRLAVGCKLYNMIFGLKDKISKDFLTKFQTEAEFVLMTYNKLRELALKKSCPTTDQIVFLNPLTKHHSSQEVIGLDITIGALHRHKCRKPYFSYLFDSAQVPQLSQEEYKAILGVENCLFYRLRPPQRAYYDNPLSEELPHLSDDHIQFFLLRELFRGRKNLKQLVERFKETIAYKLFLFSNNVYPSFLTSENVLAERTREVKQSLDKQVYAQITRMFTLLSSTCTTSFEFTLPSPTAFPSEDIALGSLQKRFPLYPPLVEKKKDRNYYLTSLGEALLLATVNYEGIETNLSVFLKALAKTLYQDASFSSLSLRVLLRFFCQLLRIDSIHLPSLLEQYLEGTIILSHSDLAEVVEQFIDREFSFLANDYTGAATIQLLGAFEQLMDTEALLFYHQLRDHKKEQRQSWETKRREAILDLGKHQLLTVGEVSQKFGLGHSQATKLLKQFVSEGFLTTFSATDCRGQMRNKYCSPSLLASLPYLTKTCGSCKEYNSVHKSCSLLRLLQANTSSAFPFEYLTYVQFPIEETATACEYFEDTFLYEITGQRVSFTQDLVHIGRKMQHISSDFLLGQTKEVCYHCLTCQEVIEEFGTGRELFFPRKRVVCGNCGTVYLKKDDSTIAIHTEHRHLLRMKYYQITGSIPQILLEKEPSFAYTIYDTENCALDMTDVEQFMLTICDQQIPLEKVHYLFFAGEKYKTLEKQLIELAELIPEKYHYTIKRSDYTPSTEKEELPATSPSFTSEEYVLTHQLINYLFEKKIFNNSFSIARNLSNVGGLLFLQKELLKNAQPSTRITRQLFEMVDLLLKVHSGVRSSKYSRQLEALSNNFFFELVKIAGDSAGLWTYGRVISRLVKDIFLSYSKKTSNAYSPLDALLNQIVRVFRGEIDKLFREVGLDPKFLGPGLFHRRKTKSDIDQLGLYFDLIEPIRVLALIVLYQGMTDGTFTASDCSQVLGKNNQEIFRVTCSAQEKIKQSVDEALVFQVMYRGAKCSFLDAFREYLLSFKEGMQGCIEELAQGKELTNNHIIKSFKEANFSPFTFCPEGCQQELALLHSFTGKFSPFFEGIEEAILESDESRSSLRDILMMRWRVIEKGSERIRITHHQQKEQERSLLVVLVLLTFGIQNNYYFAHYPTSTIREVVGLTQNQTQRILTQMVTRGFLLKEKIQRVSYYQLHLENKAVQELLFTVGLIPCEDEGQIEFFKENQANLLPKLENLVGNFNSKNIHWLHWSPPKQLQEVADWVSNQLALHKQINPQEGIC